MTYFTSSGNIFGGLPENSKYLGLNEEDKPYPKYPYAETKFAVEKYLKKKHLKKQVQLKILKNNLSLLESISQKILEEEVIEGEDLKSLLSESKMPV